MIHLKGHLYYHRTDRKESFKKIKIESIDLVEAFALQMTERKGSTSELVHFSDESTNFETNEESNALIQIRPFTFKMNAIERTLCQTDNFSSLFLGGVESTK